MGTTEIEFYWRPGCPFCSMLRSSLEGSGLPVRDVNIWEEPDAAARVRAVANGNEVVPTVFVGEHALVNPTMKELIALVRAEAPHLLEAPEAT
ncbi:glutaredoxin family protein [Prauserella cavernicola]|uniref:NrdH-redoxin n=1 Tax=Prauserella cavernicola TaxID=2800127 RepID=A0A934QT87_9PSEU|nr:glutaredoxin domain-containing protein [Prauserella cavernicola]MBK1784973.1 NrdH-redoxin [Prauserella cavernicola]